MPREVMTQQDEQLILDIVLIAKSIGVQALAEGVENQQVHDFVTSAGITYAQGYLYSPAMPEVEFWNWVRERTQGGSLVSL
jgi:EAL domain-containing protein (putative c-di-GMP-specific phosphodiesterase class I)